MGRWVTGYILVESDCKVHLAPTIYIYYLVVYRLLGCKTAVEEGGLRSQDALCVKDEKKFKGIRETTSTCFT